MEFVDTHCHIHSDDYKLDPGRVVAAANKDGVERMIVVGTNLTDSRLAVEFARRHKNVWASVGIHPHEAKDYINDQKKLDELKELAKQPKVVAIGETGLDYHYRHSSKEEQKKLFNFHLALATLNGLPIIFHVREAFEDFWPILDSAEAPLKGVIHSFSSTKKDAEELLQRDLFVGLNGIVTFTTVSEQLDTFKALPLNKILLETDAPFLTPTPYRGTICEPKHVAVTAKFLSELRNESLEKIAQTTTHNAMDLFGF